MTSKGVVVPQGGKLDGPVQATVLLVQVEALGADDMIRSELKKKGFAITHQALVHLSIEEAQEFVLNISNPDSEMYQTVPGDGTVTNEASTSRPSSANPSRSVSDIPKERPEDIVKGLTQGPLLLLALEKVQAISELLQLVGSFDPETWLNDPTTLRARFGKDRVQIGVRCCQHETTCLNELEFLLKHTHVSNSFNGNRTRMNASNMKSTQVDFTQLLNFLFPPHVQHPHSTGRLFVFGLYGPLDHDANLRSGEKGHHVVTDLELTTMSNRMEREDILAVYNMCSLSQEEEEEVLRHVDQELKHFPRYTKRDIETLFKPLKRDKEGKLCFHDMQTVIMKERCRRVVCMKERMNPRLAPPIQNAYRHTIRRLIQTHDEIAPATMFLKDLGMTGAENATLISRLLSTYGFSICHLEDGNSPSLTQNVRLVRQEIYNREDKRSKWI